MSKKVYTKPTIEKLGADDPRVRRFGREADRAASDGRGAGGGGVDEGQGGRVAKGADGAEMN